MKRALSLRTRAELALVGITAIWGSTFLTVRSTLHAYDPLSFLALRFGLGTLVLLPVSLRQRWKLRTVRPGIYLGLLLFTGFALQTWGLVFTTASRSAFLTGMSVVLVPGVALLLFRRVPSPPAIAGVLVAALGLFVLTRGGAAELAPGDRSKGDVLTLACACVYAFHIVLTDKFAREHAAMPLVVIQLAVVTVLATVALPFVPGHHASFSGEALLGVAYCGVFATALAIGVQTWAQAHTVAVRAALIYTLEPVFAAALGAALGLEQLGRGELMGGALILTGVLVSEVGGALLKPRR